MTANLYDMLYVVVTSQTGQLRVRYEPPVNLIENKKKMNKSMNATYELKQASG